MILTYFNTVYAVFGRIHSYHHLKLLIVKWTYFLFVIVITKGIGIGIETERQTFFSIHFDFFEDKLSEWIDQFLG